MLCLAVRYRFLCMLMLVFRFGYYVRSHVIISEEQFTRFQSLITLFESRHPELKHPKSPTNTVGSTLREDYPPSVVRAWMEHEASGSLSHWSERIDKLIVDETLLLTKERSA